MYEIIDYLSFNDFYDSNKKAIYKNRLQHYHLISFIERLNSGETSVYQAYNVIDNNGGNAIAVWGDSTYYLYSLQWSSDVIIGLLNKIEISKYTKRFTFCGTHQLILGLFEKSNIPYTIYKERIIYECKEANPLPRACEGSAFNSSWDDLDTISEMTYQYGLEEWGEREGRDKNHAKRSAYQSILSEASCHWEVNNEICSIAQIIDKDSDFPIIGSLYTNVEQRKKGYARFLVSKITSQLLKGGYSQCGIVSDASDPITNKMFTEVGFYEISKYIAINTLRETLEA
jgi:hypothetical protein